MVCTVNVAGAAPVLHLYLRIQDAFRHTFECSEPVTAVTCVKKRPERTQIWCKVKYGVENVQCVMVLNADSHHPLLVPLGSDPWSAPRTRCSSFTLSFSSPGKSFSVWKAHHLRCCMLQWLYSPVRVGFLYIVIFILKSALKRLFFFSLIQNLTYFFINLNQDPKTAMHRLCC